MLTKVTAYRNGRAGCRVASGLKHLVRGARNDSGQTLVVAALCMTVLIGFLGLAIDAGQLRYQKRQLQKAADAAALAGALELAYCGGTLNCASLRSATASALSENGFAGSTIRTQCAAGSGNALEVMINNPPCALSGDPNIGRGAYVEVVLSKPQPTLFAKVLGIKSIPLAARGEAGRTGGGSCMFALDPTGSNAIVVDLFASVSSSCGIMDESSAFNALGCYLFAAIQASQISVVGGVSNLLCSISPAPKTNVAMPSPADPLASLAKPSVPACGTSTKSPFHGSGSAVNISGVATLYPDAAYCGGITILPGANVTFEPGVYVLTSTNKGANTGPGGLHIDVGTLVSGTGVTFYNYGPSGGVTFNFTSCSFGGVNLVAPTNGVYGGILFFQDPQNTAQATILGSPDWNTVLEGTYYFPKAKVVFAFSGPVKYNILVAYDIEFSIFTFGSTTTSSNFASDYGSLANGSPVAGSGAAVVQ
jgi:Flp pilus assembly protein TadG